MRAALACLLVAVSGAVVGVSASVVWIILDIPSRVMDIFGIASVRGCGWALATGVGVYALAQFAGFSARLGQAAGVLALLLGGASVGMLSSALAEVAEVVPRFFTQFGLTGATGWLVVSMAVGKASGAFLSSCHIFL